ncbi:hypothetical protein Syun_021057 [Stephania yunnanensis]|uniref:1,3-beta-glucan synthase component FKS1-like domain-containing protein n=1 Tax=Stephania yunnanensis TaxID=152371 RepID=A0AAP0IFD4_9MAGN
MMEYSPFDSFPHPLPPLILFATPPFSPTEDVAYKTLISTRASSLSLACLIRCFLGLRLFSFSYFRSHKQGSTSRSSPLTLTTLTAVSLTASLTGSRITLHSSQFTQAQKHTSLSLKHLLDWLGIFFWFQRDNIRNQQEHLVLHLANAQMRLQTPPDPIGSLNPSVIYRFRRGLLSNYSSWCSYLGQKSKIWLPEPNPHSADLRRELLYAALYFPHMGGVRQPPLHARMHPLHLPSHSLRIEPHFGDYIDENTRGPVIPSTCRENGFLNLVVMPVYDLVKREVESSRNGNVPHSAWRNYGDINEYFWSRRCIRRLSWPFDLGSSFFVEKGKTGFVEQSSFWNVFRSFDRLWVLSILFLQASIIVV